MDNSARDALIRPFNICTGAVEKETDLDILQVASRKKEKNPHQHQPCGIRFSPVIIIAHRMGIEGPQNQSLSIRDVFIFTRMGR